MSGENIAYYKSYGEMGYYSLHKLSPTGRWKLKSGPYDVNTILVEHQRTIFGIPTITAWFREDDIVFCREETEEVFTCHQSQKH